MNVDRRTVLKGMLMSVAAASHQAVVQLASREDIMMLATRGPEVLIGADAPLDSAPTMNLMTPLYVLNEQRNLYQRIGFITELEVRTSEIEITMARDAERRFMPGMPSISGRFRACR